MQNVSALSNMHNLNTETVPLSAAYPDPSIIALESSFKALCLMNAGVERLALGTRWGEGPVWFGDQRCLIWSDIPNNRLLRYDEEAETISLFRYPSNKANGNTRDRAGRLVSCEHETRRVTRTEYDGRVTIIIDQFNGRPLNSPNDVIVKSDGSIWFTDPPFGIASDYEGRQTTPTLPAALYRVDGQTGETRIMADDILGPNGLCFSPDESKLYVVESRGVPNRTIRAIDVSDSGTLHNSRILVDAGPGTPDGIRCDIHGNIWAGWGMGRPELDGVMIFNPEGTAIGRIALPERCANLCFGGRAMNRLFMACGHGLYALYLNTRGIT